MGTQVIEIVERRRSWPTETKLKVVMEALQPGTSIAATADRHGVARGLVYTWMRLAREGRLRGLLLQDKPPAAFVPVRIEKGRIEEGRVEEVAPTLVRCVRPAVGAGPPHAGQPCGSARPVAQPTPRASPRPGPPIHAVPARRRTERVEITLANGRIVKVDESIDAAALARLVAALDGGGCGDSS